MGQIQKSYSASFTSTGSAKIFNLAYLPRSVFFLNKSKYSSASANLVRKAYGFSSDANGRAYVDYSAAASSVLNGNVITSGGFSFITKDTPVFGSNKTVTAISKAAAAQVTAANHGYAVGDTVWIVNTDNMDNVSGFPVRVQSIVGANDFTINFNTNTANFTAATSGTVKQLLYPDLYIPFGCVIGNVSQATSAVITTTVAHSFVVGQKVKFSGFANFGMTEMEGLEGNVTAVSTTSITVDINSSAFTAFAWPASTSGNDLPMVISIGDTNFGFTGPTPPSPLGISGAFSANTGYQVIVGTGNGTIVMHDTGDICEVHFDFPEQLGDSIAYTGS